MASDLGRLVPAGRDLDGRGRVGRVGLAIDDDAVLARQEEGVVAVDEGVDAVESDEVGQGHRQCVVDRGPTAELVEAPQVVLKHLDGGDALVAGGQHGEHLEGVVVELGDGLAAVAPDHPAAVGVRPRHHPPEVAGPTRGDATLASGLAGDRSGDSLVVACAGTHLVVFRSPPER